MIGRGGACSSRKTNDYRKQNTPSKTDGVFYRSIDYFKYIDINPMECQKLNCFLQALLLSPLQAMATCTIILRGLLSLY